MEKLNFFPSANAHNLATFNRTDPNLTAIIQQNVPQGVPQPPGLYLTPIMSSSYKKSFVVTKTFWVPFLRKCFCTLLCGRIAKLLEFSSEKLL